MRIHPTESDPTEIDPEPYWRNKVRIRQFFCMSRDWHSVSTCMNRLTDALSANPLFDEFVVLRDFRDQGDIDQANVLLDQLYDYCDEKRIWVD